jgi:hypothetical protein
MPPALQTSWSQQLRLLPPQGSPTPAHATQWVSVQIIPSQQGSSSLQYERSAAQMLPPQYPLPSP